MNMDTTATFIDVLPDRDGQRFTIHYFPGLLPGCGVVQIEGKRDTTTYTINEFPHQWSGRAFRFAKVEGEGTDATEDAYSVFCSTDPKNSRCECRGFTRWGHCKHLDAITSIITNNWI